MKFKLVGKKIHISRNLGKNILINNFKYLSTVPYLVLQLKKHKSCITCANIQVKFSQ